jgi:hypothetical protein
MRQMGKMEDGRWEMGDGSQEMVAGRWEWWNGWCGWMGWGRWGCSVKED